MEVVPDGRMSLRLSPLRKLIVATLVAVGLVGAAGAPSGAIQVGPVTTVKVCGILPECVVLEIGGVELSDEEIALLIQVVSDELQEIKDNIADVTLDIVRELRFLLEFTVFPFILELKENVEGLLLTILFGGVCVTTDTRLGNVCVVVAPGG